MPFRTWMLAIAFGLIASTIWSQSGVQNGENAQNAAEGQQAEPPKPSFVTAIEGVEAAIRELKDRESEAEREHQANQAAQDLEAQAEMAEWAREVGIGTVASAVFTLGGLFLIGCTLRVSQKTLAATQKMASETTRIGEAQVGAHIILTNAECFNSPDDPEFRLSMTIRNCGQSPAYEVCASIQVPVGEAPIAAFMATDSDLGPGQATNVAARGHIPESHDFGGGPLFIRALVSLDTVFSKAMAERCPNSTAFDFFLRKEGENFIPVRCDHRPNNQG